MRKITQEAINAFLSLTRYNQSNTEVKADNDHAQMYLHGNAIANISEWVIQITIANWNTNTTRERLNWIPNVHVQQKKGKLYLNGNEWNGEWIAIN